MKKKYMTEMEARMGFALCAIRFAGIKEGGKEHTGLIGVYNTIEPLPFNYLMTVAAAWCAAFLSAIAWMLGYRRFPFECSCSRMLRKAQDMGLPTYNRGYEPRIGDWLIYDLDKNKAVDHIGAVVWVDGGKCWVVEGNFSNSVKVRCIAIDDPIVYAWICPDYMELVDNSNFVDGDRPNIPVEIPEFEEGEDMENNEKIYNQVSEMPEWAKEGVQEMVDAHIIEGVGDGQLGMDEKDVRHAMWQWRGLKRICEKLGLPGLQ